MDEKQNKKISKFLSYILRHNPETIGLQLDDNGWANIDELITKASIHHHPFSIEELKEIVETNDKKRFVLDNGGTKIRASQGHSIEVDLNLSKQQPPKFLYHGTVDKYVPIIEKEGLRKMERQHVHLSTDRDTAAKVGSRRGKPVILTINSNAMYDDGFEFYRSQNGVWLTDHVPAPYIDFGS
jgi:putative RNA 2'-phosphotransferase